jgi:hypothetical protein
MSHFEGGIGLETLSEGYYDAWSDSDLTRMVKVVEPFARKLESPCSTTLPQGKSRRARTFVIVTGGAFPSLDILFHFVNTLVYRRFESAPLFKQT